MLTHHLGGQLQPQHHAIPVSHISNILYSIIIMPICDVCLNLDWDLYPTPSTNETLTEKRGPSHPSHTLASSANRGCQLCLILHQGIVALRQYTASLLPPWGPWDFSDPCDVHIFLRPERSLLLYLDNSDYECEDNSTDLDEGEDDTALGRGYGISIEFFTSAGGSLLLLLTH